MKILLRASFAFVAPACIWACSCAAPPPPCEMFGRTPLVFTGTVLSRSPNTGYVFTAHVRVDRVYKGAVPAEIDLADDGMCDGPILQPGSKILIYGNAYDGRGPMPARGCGRSTNLEHADEDLAYLKQLESDTPETYVTGVVRLRADPDLQHRLRDAPDEPLKGVAVRLQGNGLDLTTETDSLGAYRLSGIPAGDYSVSFTRPGFRGYFQNRDVRLVSGGCAHADDVFRIDRRVEGTVSVRGKPAAGAVISMIREPDKTGGEQPILITESGEDGHYSVEGIPPGNYRLGVNVTKSPTKESPFLPTYFPGTPEPQKADLISFFTGAAERRADFEIPEPLRVVWMQGLVLKADGSPAVRANIVIKGEHEFDRVQHQPIESAMDGTFEYELCEGVRYWISATRFATDFRNVRVSTPVEFVPSAESNRLVFRLNKTSEEARESSAAPNGKAGK